MSKRTTCSQVIGRAIRKYGLEAVVSTVEMAMELSATPAVKPTRVTKNNVVGTQAAIAVSTTTQRSRGQEKYFTITSGEEAE
jgi:hypothetical protein